MTNQEFDYALEAMDLTKHEVMTIIAIHAKEMKDLAKKAKVKKIEILYQERLDIALEALELSEDVFEE